MVGYYKRNDGDNVGILKLQMNYCFSTILENGRIITISELMNE